MRKLLVWIVVSIGVAALVRKLRRRGGEGAPEAELTRDEPAAGDPADELRRKLADTRDAGDSAAAPAADAPAEPDATVDERRSEVHEEGRAAIDEMQQSTED